MVVEKRHQKTVKNLPGELRRRRRIFPSAMHKMHNFFTLRRPNVLKQALLCCAYHGMRAKGDLEVF